MHISELMPFIVVLGAILLDIVSGLIKGGATGTLSSSIMREGLWHKAALILLEFTAFGAQLGCIYIEELPQELAVVYIGTSAYIVIMELVSILENIAIANPDIATNKLFSLFGIQSNENNK